MNTLRFSYFIVAKSLKNAAIKCQVEQSRSGKLKRYVKVFIREQKLEKLHAKIDSRVGEKRKVGGKIG